MIRKIGYFLLALVSSIAFALVLGALGVIIVALATLLLCAVIITFPFACIGIIGIMVVMGFIETFRFFYDPDGLI